MMGRGGGKGRYGLHIYTHNRTDWVTWFESRVVRDQEYAKAKAKQGMDKGPKTPYRIVKKVQR